VTQFVSESLFGPVDERPEVGRCDPKDLADLFGGKLVNHTEAQRLAHRFRQGGDAAYQRSAKFVLLKVLLRRSTAGEEGKAIDQLWSLRLPTLMLSRESRGIPLHR
jgi:hypothetical protein